MSTNAQIIFYKGQTSYIAKVQIAMYDFESEIDTLALGEVSYAEDTEALWIGTNSGNVQLNTGSGGTTITEVTSLSLPMILQMMGG